MPKTVLLSLKNGKNRQTLGALLPDLLASGGWGGRPPTPQTPIPPFLFFFLPLSPKLCPQITDSFGINKAPYFLLIIAEVHQAYVVEKDMLYFVSHRLR